MEHDTDQGRGHTEAVTSISIQNHAANHDEWHHDERHHDPHHDQYFAMHLPLAITSYRDSGN